MADHTMKEMPDTYSSAHEQVETLISRLRSDETHSLDHGAVEALIRDEGRELQRRLLQAHLDERASRETKLEWVRGEDGRERTHCRSGCGRNIATIFGEVTAQRKGYGGRQLTSVFPLDKELNLPMKHKYSSCLQHLAAELVAKNSFEDSSTTIERLTGSRVGKRQLEELAQHVAQDFTAYYRQRAKIPESPADLLVLSCDGKGIVMHSEDLREATRKAAQGKQNKLKTRLSRGEKRNRKRMATVAAVYSLSTYQRTAEQILGVLETEERPPPRPKPRNKRVWASVEQDMESVIEELVQEALKQDPSKVRTWLMLVDGSESQLKAIKRVVKRYKVKVVIVQDFIHVLEYLWKAAYCFNIEGSEAAEKWVMERALGVLQGRASTVAAGIRRSATQRGLAADKRKAADKCSNYLLKNKKRLDYATALENGWPIATGVIEGACRYLIKDRMDITGARWRLNGAEAILRLRALHSHGVLDDYMAFHSDQERERNYEQAA